MISVRVKFEYETSDKLRRHAYKSIFETDREDFDYGYDSPAGEAVVEIAELFGFDPSYVAEDIIYEKMDGHDMDSDNELVQRAFEFIESENIACYRIGTCPHNKMIFEEDNCFCYADDNELFCLLKDTAKEECSMHRLTHVANHLASLREDVLLNESVERIKPYNYDNYAAELDASSVGN